MSDVGNVMEFDGESFVCVRTESGDSCDSCYFSDRHPQYVSGRCHQSPCNEGHYVPIPVAISPTRIVIQSPQNESKPTKAMMLPADPVIRKGIPITSGVLDYFPLAIAEVAKCSKAGNDQHNPGQPLHWDKTKSTDHADCIARHLIDRGTCDEDGVRHSAKLAWRALALLQIELEAEAS